MRRNYVCELVTCNNWNGIENANQDIVIEEINEKCQQCKHSRLSVLKDCCNFVDNYV